MSSSPLPAGSRREFTLPADADAAPHAYTVAAFPVIDEDETIAEYVGIVSEKPFSLSFLSADATHRQDILTSLTGQLVRGARAMASLTTNALCKRADISPSTLAKIEDETGPIMRITKMSTAVKILTTLENEGVAFGFSQDGKLALCVG